MIPKTYKTITKGFLSDNQQSTSLVCFLMSSKIASFSKLDLNVASFTLVCA